MEYFKEILSVHDTEGIDTEGKLEQAKAFALDEIFTDNTNLSLNVKEDEILGMFGEAYSAHSSQLHLVAPFLTATPF